MAQSNHEVISKIQELMLANYIFLDKAEATNQHLDELMKTNYFEAFKTPEDFAKALTKEMQKITEDKHLNIAPPRPRNTVSRERTSFDWHLQNLVRFRESGFQEVNFFEGNIAYFQLKGFRVEDTIKVAPLMSFLSTADAIIIDLRDNGGGNGPVGLNLSSYFLAENTPLTGVYERRIDRMENYSTIAVKGEQRLDVPLFILTNQRTFSAAEAFAYDLQARKRAIIMGKKTGGGAHPVNFMRLPNSFGLIVPVARSINPVTNSNWEGIGIIPDIEISTDQVLDEAKKIAKASAKTYREAPFKELEKTLKKTKLTASDENTVYQLLQLLLKRKHIENFMVNQIGYDYLEEGYLSGTLAVQKTATLLFPNSPNAHDSYAEVLIKNKQNQLALEHYEKAVSLAIDQNDRRLELYQKKLDEFRSNNELPLKK